MTGTSLYRNPRLLVLVIGVIVVAGFASFTSLPRMEDPEMTQRFGIIRTVFPGADAERVESQVSEPIEEAIRKIKGIKVISSESLAGSSKVGIELKQETVDVAEVWSLVRDELSEVTKSLPDGAFEPEFMQPDLKAFAAIVALRWERSTDPNYTILGRISEDLKTVIRGVNGTENVDVHGKPDEEILVELAPGVLDGIGLTVADVSTQIKESEAKSSAGMQRNDESELVIEIDGDFDSIERLGNTPIRYGAEGKLTNLSDIAEISKGYKNPPSSLAFVDGKPSVVVAAFVRNAYRIDHWAAQLDKELETFKDTLPPGVKMDVIFSQNKYVGERLDQLGMNLLIGTLAVMVVVFFLMGWRSMVVVAVALPLSALMVLTGMRFLDIPIHQMSVTGLIIALGLLIDNAIVMVDEVRSSMREGKKAPDAIATTIKHLALPLFGSTLTTTLAFAPIALLPGGSGEFVGSIAVSVILAINASFLLAMSVVPALTALIQPRKTGAKEIAKSQRGVRGFLNYGFSNGGMSRFYHWLLVHFFRVPVLGVVLGAALPVFGFYIARELPEQFFPPVDRDQMHIELEMPANTSLEKTHKVTTAIREKILEHEGVSRVHWFLGESAPRFFYNVVPKRKNSPFYAQAFVELSSTENSRDTIRDLQTELDRDFPQSRILVRQLEQGPAFDAPVEVKLFGPDLAVLQKLGNELRLVMSQTSEVVHTRSDLSEAVPKLTLEIDEYETRMAGMSHHEVAQQLYTSLEGIESGTLVETTEEIPIRVRIGGDIRTDPGKIESLDLRALTPRGRSATPTPLSAVSSLTLGSEVSSIPRINGKRVNEVKAYITAGTLPDKVVTEFRRRLADSDFELPPGYTMEYGGEAAQRDEAVGGLVADIGMLIALMIATLVSSFRSFRVAFIITVVGGLSIGLGVGAIWAFGFPFGFMGVVGTMGLVGVAVNDAIVVMAGIRDSPEANDGDVESIASIVIHRTRHIIATTLTTIAGFIPLVLGGGSFWPPVAIAIAGGVGGSTLLALFFVPSLYLVFIGRIGYTAPKKKATSPKKKAPKRKTATKKTTRKKTATSRNSPPTTDQT